MGILGTLRLEVTGGRLTGSLAVAAGGLHVLARRSRVWCGGVEGCFHLLFPLRRRCVCDVWSFEWTRRTSYCTSCEIDRPFSMVACIHCIEVLYSRQSESRIERWLDGLE